MLSVITVVFNRADVIEATLNSVYLQKDSVQEHIIIDGASTDDTVKKIKSFIATHNANYIKLFSEKDHGVYNALNKGIEKAQGEVIGLLHAGDVFVAGSLQKLTSLVSNTENFHNKLFAASARMPIDGRMTEFLRSEKPKLSVTNPKIRHSSIFVPKNIYDQVGLYNENYKISSDYDFIARALKTVDDVVYTDLVVVEMEPFGFSSKHFLRKTYEQFVIQLRYAGFFKAIINILWPKKIKILKAFVKRILISSKLFYPRPSKTS